MVGQVTNLNNVDSAVFNLIEYGKTTKPLPKVNSIVVINVLEKFNNGFKVLIDGRVFFSKLPVNINTVSIGETLIAKVLSHQPFTLSLDNLINIKNLEQSLTLLLSKLQIDSSEIAKKILKAYLTDKKPLIKSKMEKLINQINHDDLNLSEEQMGFLVNLANSPEFDNDINSSVVRLLSFSPKEISEEIFNRVKSIISYGKNTNLISVLNDAFVLDLNEPAQLDTISIKEKSNQIKKFLEFINDNVDQDETTLEEIKFLKDRIVKYNLLKAYYQSQGIHIAFIIIKNGDTFEKFEYQVESYNHSFQNRNGNYAINLDMNPANLSEININGIYNQESLYLKMKSEKPVLTKLIKNKIELTDKIEKEIKIPYRIDFEERHSGNSGTDLKGFSKVNVTV